MKEYIKRKAARELIEQVLGDEWKIQYANDRLDEIPAADVVEVVRCKDCALCRIGANDTEAWCWCLRWSNDTDPTGYCSYGKRKHGADDV